MDTRKDGF